MKQNSIPTQIVVAWNRLPLVVRAVLTGFMVSSVGIAVWGLMLTSWGPAWAVPLMVIVLWAYLKFASGGWDTKGRNDFKRIQFRSVRLSPAVWKWGITAALLFVIVVQASFVVTYRFLDFPSEKFTADYKILDSMPLPFAWAALIMASVVAGICEETGFRGYMQVPIEKKYGPAVGIIVTSSVFAVIHLSHSWALPILPHIFFASCLLGLLAYHSQSLIPGIIGHSILDIFDYSFWWSDLTGGFHKKTIFVTGIDLHFIVWLFIFLLSVCLFFMSLNRLKMPIRSSNF
jgi:membrane protease YdiL (CAAX protease family)